MEAFDITTFFTATKHFEPRFGRNRELTPPWSHRGLQRWKKLAPSSARLLLPFVGFMALMRAAINSNLRPFALEIMIVFSGYLRPKRVAHSSADRSDTTPNVCGLPTPVLGSPLVSDCAQCVQQDIGLRRMSGARLPVDDLARSLDRSSAAAAADAVYLTFRPFCLHRHSPLRCGTSQRRLPRLAASWRSIARRRDRTQKPGSDQGPRTVSYRVLSPTLQKGKHVPSNESPCSIPRKWLTDGPSKVTSNTVCTTNIDSHAARRRSLQTAP